MPIQSNAYQFAEERAPNVAIRPIIGAYELLFMISGVIQRQNPEPHWFRVFSARISVRTSRGTLDLGTASLAAPVLILQREHPQHFSLEFKIVLSPSQLSALDDWRASGDLHFDVSLAGFSGYGNVQNDHAEHQTIGVPVPQSVWVSHLKTAKVVDTLLIEIPLPFFGATQAEKSVEEHLRRAQQHFLLGSYPDCVTECRKAAEVLEQGAASIWSSAGTADQRKLMDKSERERLLLASLKHYAHLSAHSSALGGTLDYKRADAKLALAVIAALAAH